MNPLWNNLIVAGIETESDNKPFIGVITQRGVAYTVNFQLFFCSSLFKRAQFSKNSIMLFLKDEYFNNIAKIIFFQNISLGETRCEWDGLVPAEPGDRDGVEEEVGGHHQVSNSNSCREKLKISTCLKKTNLITDRRPRQSPARPSSSPSITTVSLIMISRLIRLFIILSNWKKNLKIYLFQVNSQKYLCFLCEFLKEVHYIVCSKSICKIAYKAWQVHNTWTFPAQILHTYSLIYPLYSPEVITWSDLLRSFCYFLKTFLNYGNWLKISESFTYIFGQSSIEKNWHNFAINWVIRE